MYNTRTWLNPTGHTSTGYIICFDGTYIDNGDEYYESYFKIGDCKNSVKFHRWPIEPDCDEKYLIKLKLISNELNNFINYLENKIITEKDGNKLQ